ncbi:hypothetical protein BDY24DRAFT_417655 [Mrakia frigida]|uniref:uncharacterized protein n=1 Tax=Mrakia frigida TaxID=29902 RepID=UPI003FCC17A7
MKNKPALVEGVLFFRTMNWADEPLPFDASPLLHFRLLFHLILALLALIFFHEATNSISCVRSSDPLRQQVLLLAATIYGALSVLRVEDLFEPKECTFEEMLDDTVVERELFWMNAGVRLNGALYWGAILFPLVASPSPIVKRTPLLLYLSSSMGLLFLASLLHHLLTSRPIFQTREQDLEDDIGSQKESSSLLSDVDFEISGLDEDLSDENALGQTPSTNQLFILRLPSLYICLNVRPAPPSSTLVAALSFPS